jgi:hypothetical protein
MISAMFVSLYSRDGVSHRLIVNHEDKASAANVQFASWRGYTKEQ